MRAILVPSCDKCHFNSKTFSTCALTLVKFDDTYPKIPDTCFLAPFEKHQKEYFKMAKIIQILQQKDPTLLGEIVDMVEKEETK